MPGKLLAGHVFLDDGNTTEPNNVPIKKWSNFRFDLLDILYISPFVVLPDGTFGLSGTGSEQPKKKQIVDRFEGLVALARSRNAKIKIIAMQFWGSNTDGKEFAALNTEQLQATYAKSVAAFLQTYSDKTGVAPDGKTVKLRVDGFDVDYEWNSETDIGNQQTWAPKVLAMIREQVNVLSQQKQLDHFTVSVTPASAYNLVSDTKYPDPSIGPSMKLENVLDYLSMQNYDGGFDHHLSEYTGLNALPNLALSKIFWGINVEGTTKGKSYGGKRVGDKLVGGTDVEEPSSNNENGSRVNFGVGSVDDVVHQVVSQKLGGAMVWRLNSDNWVFQNMVLVALYNKFNGHTSPDNLIQNLAASWRLAGRVSFWPDDKTLPGPDQNPLCTEAAWQKANGYRS